MNEETELVVEESPKDYVLVNNEGPWYANEHQVGYWTILDNIWVCQITRPNLWNRFWWSMLLGATWTDREVT